MKISIKKLFVLLAVVMSLVAIQAVWADTLTVTGTIERIGTSSIDVKSEITGELYTFYDIPFSDLATQGIVLNVGDSVTVYAYVVTFPNGKVKNIAYSITYGDVTYTWHPNVPKAGSMAKSGSETTALSLTDYSGALNCNCICLDDLQDCHCRCGEISREPNQ